MNSQQFAIIFDQVMKASSEVLFAKAQEYATDDERLHNFKVAAALMSSDPTQALGGFMLKHTVSIYDMIQAGDPTKFSAEQWDEKIGDHINYLILLRAVVYEAFENEIQSHPTLFTH